MKYLLFFFNFFFISNCISQSLPVATPLRFYGNYQDFLDDKPLANYEIIRKKNPQRNDADENYGLFKVRQLTEFENLNYEKLLINVDGKEEKLKPKNYPSLFLTNEDGALIRIFDEIPYYVILTGVYCHYIDALNCKIIFENNTIKIEKFTSADFFSENYISTKIDGDIKLLKEKELKKILSNYDLLSEYENKKKQIKYFQIESHNKAMFYMDILKLLNTKIDNN